MLNLSSINTVHSDNTTHNMKHTRYRPVNHCHHCWTLHHLQQLQLHPSLVLSAKMLTCQYHLYNTHTHTHPFLTALCPGLPRWAGTRKVKPIWILLKQETVSGNGIRWAICKSAPRSRQITTLAPHHSVFYRPDALPATQPTASKHWRIIICTT